MIKAKTKKPKQYHYNFEFNSGRYSDVSWTLEDEFPESFAGSGTLLGRNEYDVSFICTPAEVKMVVAFIKKTWNGLKFTQAKWDL